MTADNSREGAREGTPVVGFAFRDRNGARFAFGTAPVKGGSFTVAPKRRSVLAMAIAHFDVGIVKSAPLGVDSGQRCITDF
jgi:hypothetical protein